MQQIRSDRVGGTSEEDDNDDDRNEEFATRKTENNVQLRVKRPTQTLMVKQISQQLSLF